MALTESANAVEVASVAPAAKKKTKKKAWWRRSILAYSAGIYLVLIVILCVAAPLLPLADQDSYQGAVNAEPLGSSILGTDQLGRDVLSRVLYGGRVSLFIALVSTVVALVLGLALGLIGGYFGGWRDTIIRGAIDIMLAFPALVLFMIIIAARGATVTNVIIGASIVLTTSFARLARGGTIKESQREYVRAARGLGARNTRVILRELLPNVLPALSTYALTAAGFVILIEGGLSFLGLGVPPPTPTWGSMIQGGRAEFHEHPWVTLVPAIVMSLTIVSFNVLGDHLRKGRNSDTVEGARL
jgi:peptide/nickel transport system permease protein